MSAHTDISICNLALARIGQAPIVSFNDGSQEAHFCSVFYDTARRAALRAAPWNFATKVETLAVATGEEDTKYSAVYSLPSGCIRALKLINPAADDELEFVVREQLLLCDVEDAELEYIFDVDDETKFDDSFVSCLAYYLASELAIPIANSAKLKDMMFREFMSSRFEAKGINASEKRAKVEPGQDFVNARA